jgi:hypothetical protein
MRRYEKGAKKDSDKIASRMRSNYKLFFFADFESFILIWGNIWEKKIGKYEKGAKDYKMLLEYSQIYKLFLFADFESLVSF